MDVFGELLDKKLIMITGKGGIGKSITAAILGQALAESGKSVLLIQNSSIDQISPLFGPIESNHKTVRVYPNLDVLNVDSTTNFRDYIVEYHGFKKLYRTIFSNQLVRSFIDTMPGWADVMLLGRLLFECELRARHDLVIFDGPASGHFYSLMTTPDSLLSMSLGGPMGKETERVKAFLSNPKHCQTIYVAVPEMLVVSECLDFIPKLRSDSPAHLAGIILNRMPEPLGPEVRIEGPGARYVYQHGMAGFEAKAALEDGIRGQGLSLWGLPDLGFIEEPLKPGFGKSIISRATLLQRS